MAALGKKEYKQDANRLECCDNCGSFTKGRKIKGAYGRCLAVTMYDARPDGTIVEETGRPAARFADDYCDLYSTEVKLNAATN